MFVADGVWSKKNKTNKKRSLPLLRRWLRRSWESATRNIEEITKHSNFQSSTEQRRVATRPYSGWGAHPFRHNGNFMLSRSHIVARRLFTFSTLRYIGNAGSLADDPLINLRSKNHGKRDKEETTATKLRCDEVELVVWGEAMPFLNSASWCNYDIIRFPFFLSR